MWDVITHLFRDVDGGLTKTTVDINEYNYNPLSVLSARNYLCPNLHAGSPNICS